MNVSPRPSVKFAAPQAPPASGTEAAMSGTEPWQPVHPSVLQSWAAAGAGARRLPIASASPTIQVLKPRHRSTIIPPFRGAMRPAPGGALHAVAVAGAGFRSDA